MSLTTEAASGPSSAPMRRLAAVYFADLVGYTGLSARDESAALDLVGRFQNLSRRSVSEHGGRIVKFVGDAVLAEFVSAESAVQSALALDASMRDESGGNGARASLRTGVHLAELTFTPDGDIYGDGVNVAARLQSEATAGRVLVSEDVWRQLKRRPVFSFTDGGRRELKGHPEPVSTFEVRLRYELPETQTAPAAAPAAARAAGEGDRTRMVVLPFRVLKSDSETDFLSFALADAITVSLSGLHSLTVRSSVAALRFATDAPDLKALAEQAEVDQVLAGTLLRAGEQLRVSAQLFDAAKGTVRWSETFQAGVGDLFALQDELTNRIVRSLAEPLTAREQRMLKRDVPATARAYEFYLRANQLAGASASWTSALELYEAALAEDPLYAPAWARLGRCHRVLGKYSNDQALSDRELARAEAAFRRALELNPEQPIAHTLLSQLEAERGRAPDAMERLIGRARGSTTDPELLSALVHVLRYCGLLDASLAAHELAHRQDPGVRTSVGHTLLVKCDFEGVVELVRPGNSDGVLEIALCSLGRITEAGKLFRRPDHQITPMHWIHSAWNAFLDGDYAEAMRFGREACRVFPDPEGLFYLVKQWAMMEEDDSALELLDRVLDRGYACAAPLECDPAFDRLRADPRFAARVRRAAAMRDAAHARFLAAGGPALLELDRSSTETKP